MTRPALAPTRLIWAALLLGLLMPAQAFAESLEHRIGRLEPYFTVTRPERRRARRSC